MSRRSFLTLIGAVATVLVLAGCAPPPPPQTQDESPHGEQQHDHILLIVLDVSGSFLFELGPNGRAYPYLMKLVEDYFRQRLGNNDKVIIAQISAQPKALLWSGSPRVLREQFPDADSFMKMVIANSHPAGSRVHDSITEGLEDLMSYPGIADRKIATACFVMSDMDDNFPDPPASKKRLLECLARYSKVRGSFGLYWVNQQHVPEWRMNIQKSGIKNWIVVSEIDHSPPKPVFSD